MKNLSWLFGRVIPVLRVRVLPCNEFGEPVSRQRAVQTCEFLCLEWLGVGKCWRVEVPIKETARATR